MRLPVRAVTLTNLHFCCPTSACYYVMHYHRASPGRLHVSADHRVIIMILGLQDTMLSPQQMAAIDASTDVTQKEFEQRVSNLKVDSSILKPLKLDASSATSAMESAEKLGTWMERAIEPGSSVVEVSELEWQL